MFVRTCPHALRVICRSDLEEGSANTGPLAQLVIRRVATPAKHRAVGRVTPYAPRSDENENGAHGVTRPAFCSFRNTFIEERSVKINRGPSVAQNHDTASAGFGVEFGIKSNCSSTFL